MKKQLYKVADTALNKDAVNETEIKGGIIANSFVVSPRENLFHNYTSEQLYIVSAEIENLLLAQGITLNEANSTQILTALKKGVLEWSATISYSQYDICKINSTLYVSKTNLNLNHPPAGDNTNWGQGITISSPTTISNTTESTTTTTGALIVAGGVGIAKNLNIAGIEKITNTTESSSTTTGAMVIAGGLGVAKNTNIAGIETITNTTESSSSTTGALVVAGGIGIAKKLNVAGNATFEGISFISNTTESTSIGTGAGVVAGGVGIAKNLNVGSTIRGHDSLSIDGGIYSAGDLETDGIGYLYNTLESTSTTTGSLVVSGGVGIAKNLNVGGVGKITDTTDSTSITTGSAIISGGAGIAKNLYIGKDISIAGQFHLPSSASTAISAGAITYTATNMLIDTEGGAATDNLDTITGGNDGDIIVLSITSNVRKVVVRPLYDNIVTPHHSDITLSNIVDRVVLMKDNNYWSVVSQSTQNDFYNLKSANGWTYLPNGLFFQWGIGTNLNSGSNITLTLPMTFPNATLNLSSTVLGTTNGGANCSIQAGFLNLSQIRIYNWGSLNGMNVYWFAIGC
jgi:hypothetical protein